MRSEPSPVSGAVMAGGMSSRMGTDKALIRLSENGPTLLATAVTTLAPYCEDVLIVAPDRPGYRQAGGRLVLDRWPGAGPLGGIATALHAVGTEAVVVISCDMPFVVPSLIERLAKDDSGADVVIPVLPGTNRQGKEGIFQTLCARYSRRCLPAIERRLAAGKFQIVGFFDEVVVQPVPVDELHRLDPRLSSFFSVNTPEALAEARLRIRTN